MSRKILMWMGLAIGLFVVFSPDLVTAQQAETITVEGRVERGTADGLPLPQNMVVELRVVDTDNIEGVQTLTDVIEDDGSFRFENVPRVEGNDFYVLYTTYDGLRQNTQPISVEQADFVVFLVYETTTDTSALDVLDGYIQIDEFAQIRESGTNLSIVMELEMVNRGDKIVYDPAQGYSVSFELPVGAYGVDEIVPESRPEGYRQLRIETGTIPVVHETVPLIPNWPVHTIRLTYLLLYPGSAVLDQPFPFRVEQLEVLLPSDEVFVTSEMLIKTEEQRFVARGRPLYDVYSLASPLANQSLVFTLQGEPLGTVSGGTVRANTHDENEDDLQRIFIFVGVILFILFLFGVWWVIRSRQQALGNVLDQIGQANDKDS